MSINKKPHFREVRMVLGILGLSGERVNLKLLKREFSCVEIINNTYDYDYHTNNIDSGNYFTFSPFPY